MVLRLTSVKSFLWFFSILLLVFSFPLQVYAGSPYPSLLPYLVIGLVFVVALASPGTHLMALIKPQFEIGRGQVGKGGIVRDQALLDEVCKHIESWLDAQAGWKVLGITESPITGADGNREFLIGARLE